MKRTINARPSFSIYLIFYTLSHGNLTWHDSWRRNRTPEGQQIITLFLQAFPRQLFPFIHTGFPAVYALTRSSSSHNEKIVGTINFSGSIPLAPFILAARFLGHGLGTRQSLQGERTSKKFVKAASLPLGMSPCPAVHESEAWRTPDERSLRSYLPRHESLDQDCPPLESI